MDTNRICPSCQKPLAPDVPMGLCPECLIKAGFPTGVDTGTEPGHHAAFIPPATEEIGRLFPQLEILELIGKGGMGAVYKARQKQLNRFVALKILPPGIGPEPSFAERFTREAQALAQLNHPNIVTLHEFGQAGGLHYFLMEFVDGVNLRQLLASGRVSPREALAIVPQICDALQFAHDHGIVHRDIKPENILLDRRGRVKVADFGVAKIMGSGSETTGGSDASLSQTTLTEAGKVLGTPRYMSPEQIATPREVDHRADIYALGVVFYQMLTGELPGKRIEPPSQKVQLDVRLDEVVLRALESNPERRYQQASAFKTQVETISGAAAQSDNLSTGRPFQGKPRGKWFTWAPFVSPQVREITAHFTETEKREAMGLAFLFGIWNAATGFVPLWLVMWAPKPAGWLAGGTLLVGIFGYPILIRMQSKFLCSTIWARKNGYTIENLRRFSFGFNDSFKAALFILIPVCLLIFLSYKLFHGIHDLPPSTNLNPPDPKGVTNRQDAPPFIAYLPGIKVELAAISDQPWSNRVCWLPNGQPSAELFPQGRFQLGGSSQGMVMKKIAFRIYDEKHLVGVSLPLCQINKETGVATLGCGFQPSDSLSDVAIFNQVIACPTNTTAMTVTLGVSSESWETVVTMEHESNSLSQVVENDGWGASFNSVTDNHGNVAVSCIYPHREGWETRMVYANGQGKLIPIRENGSRTGGNETGGMLLVSSNEFASIKEFRVQRRKYHWVEFQNVSLQPGHHSTVTVKTFADDEKPGENHAPSTAAVTPTASAPGAVSSIFREYNVGRTYAELIRQTNDSPETVAARFALGMVGSNPTEAMNRYTMGLPLLPAGSVTFTMSETERAGVRRTKPNKIIVYSDELAGMFKHQETNDAWTIHVLGKHKGQWKIFLTADTPNSESLAEAEEYFRQHAAELDQAFRQLPEQKPTLMEEAGKQLATNMTQMMGTMVNTMTQIVSQVPGMAANLQDAGRQMSAQLQNPRNITVVTNGALPKFQFRWVAVEGDTNSPADILEESDHNSRVVKLRVLKPVFLDERDVASAGFSTYRPDQNDILVNLNLLGTRKFSAATAENIGRQLAIVWDGRVICAPIIQSAISAGPVQISGNFTDQEAQQLLDLLNHRQPSSPPK